jgi:MFS transporter, OFA family, oxalate/formate antiporter
MNKIFYGWWVLLGLFLIYAVSNGIGLNTLPKFYPALMKEFKWDQAAVTLPGAMVFFIIAFFSPLVGFLLTRFNPRFLMMLGGIGMIISLFLFAFISSYQTFILAYVLFAVSLSFAGIIASMYILTQWFSAYRGIAVGLFVTGSSIGGMIFPQIAGRLIESQGWQYAAFVLAVVAIFFTFLPLLMIRNSPSELGLLPDGAVNNNTNTSLSSTYESSNALTFKEAIASPTFYLLAFVTATVWFCIPGIIQHQAAYMEGDLKISSVKSANIISIFFGCSILGKVIFGYLSDIFSKQIISTLAILNLTLGSLLLKLSVSNPDTYLLYYAIAYGIGFSGAFTMVQLMVAEFYQGKTYTKVYGIITMVDTLAGSMGVVILGQIRKNYGSYEPSFNLMLGLCLLALICTFWLKKPQNLNKNT